MSKELSKRQTLLQQIWLASLLVLLICMILLGGYTRLTDSGLSIVEWKPATGVIPPLNAESWQQELAKYQQTPEYKQINPDISLEEFKFIYLVEYFHRLLGRLIGLVFFIPLAIFGLKGKISSSVIGNLAAASGFGVFQAFMGWYMVKSGLKDDPFVSHYRLAFHLIIALIIYAHIFWSFMHITSQNYKRGYSGSIYEINILLRLSRLAVIITLVQIFLGGLVAGLKAGKIYNTFPLIEGQFIPEQIFQVSFASILAEPLTVQFLHRIFAYLILLLGVFYFAWICKSSFNRYLITGGKVFLFSLALQVVFGIATLLTRAEIFIALLHQFTAVIVFTSLLYLHYNLIFIKNCVVKSY